MASTNKSIVLITGANSGIGFELAAQLLADASKHILLGSRTVAKGEKAVQELQSKNLPGTVEFLQIDVSKEESINAAAKHVEEKHGRLDVLVNNAAIALSEGTPFTALVEVFTTNAAGPHATVIAFESLLVKSPHTPRIINVSSGAGSISRRLDKSNSFYAMKVEPYRVSKAALNMVSACQHAEYEERGWKVFVYCPGYTVSNLSNHNTAAAGAKPTSEGTEPIVGMVNGDRDAEAGRFLRIGGEWEW
ncbi:NAD(P)-binding protein [Massarina eburnea CBS 473.64]|uniref:NAD(P)-binding protein n=1 Tax=Massarina eburnea CBS 473.64 TaxID=1395130 RepID=A0A6A6RZ61_9PLEO|nr:NAD(P)-binding protein [Massarina eburnea CBS 473.64]